MKDHADVLNESIDALMLAARPMLSVRRRQRAALLMARAGQQLEQQCREASGFQRRQALQVMAFAQLLAIVASECNEEAQQMLRMWP